MKQKNVILMVVAVGCGLVAAFLTSQMSAKGQVEQVEVVVAAKDLPVGTMITKEDLDKSVKVVKRPKDGLPADVVVNKEEMINKRLSRPVRAEETFNPKDLSKGGVITLPEGMNMVSLPVGVSNAAAGFVGPGSHVTVIATLRLSDKLSSFKLLVNMLVVAVDTNVAYSEKGTFPTMNTVSFAVTEKQALLLSLAKARGCNLELMLLNSMNTGDDDKLYNIDETIKLLSDDRNPAKVIGGETEGKKPADPTVTTPPTTNPPEVPGHGTTPPTPAPPPAPKIETVIVLVATKNIAPNTEITKDLIKEAFVTKELPKEMVGEAIGDLTPGLGYAFPTGVAKGQWVIPDMIGDKAGKPAPRDEFLPPKPGPSVTPSTPVAPQPTPVAPPKRNYHDVTVHTTQGAVVHRYEEVAPGKWKKVAELTPEQAAKEPGDTPGAPGAKKID